MKTWIIRGAKVVDPSQNLEDTRDILIKDGKIQEIGTNIISENAEIIEANGLIVAPGLVDMHVHLRDPGQTHKETVQTGCQSAAGRRRHLPRLHAEHQPGMRFGGGCGGDSPQSCGR